MAERLRLSNRPYPTFVDEQDFSNPEIGLRGWHEDAYGYARNSDGVLLHRLILGLTKENKLQGDHINGDRLDNRRENLRAVPWAFNAQNCQGDKDSTSRFRGVSFHQGRWRARVVVGGKEHYLGSFDKEEDAAEAASNFRKQHFPYSNEDRHVC